ncbi:MAG: IS21 family transposase [Burkholderia gladioli]
MKSDPSRHGALQDFLDLIDGLTTEKITEILRCCTRSVRNWIAGRSPIPWWRIEALKTWRAQVADDAPMGTAPADSALANVLTDEQELVAWVSVHAPHFLSNDRSFRNYVAGWRVTEKIAVAKLSGAFQEIVRQWRSIKTETLRQWRCGPRSSADDGGPRSTPNGIGPIDN